MFALVRFVHEEDNRLHIVPVDDIEKFNPSEETDFDNRLLYSVMWRDDVNEENTGIYSGQILMLDRTRDGLEKRQARKRVHIPKLYVEVVSSDEEEDRKKERKRRKHHREAAKTTAYEQILQSNVEAALNNNCVPTSRAGEKTGAKRTRSPSSSSGESDSLCARSELLNAIKEKKMWKRRAIDLENQNRKLLEQTSSLQRCLQSEIFNLEARFKLCTSGGRSPARFERARTPVQGNDESCDLPASPAVQRHVPDAEPASSQPAQTEAQKPDFSYMQDGFFHLKNGFSVSGAQAAKIFGNKKGTLVCKDAAQALWGSAVLANRSVSGNVAPKKKALGELPKQQLTPKKMDVVVATIQHWGKEKNVDVSETLKNLSRLLTEKIQDVSKALRKLDK